MSIFYHESNIILPYITSTQQLVPRYEDDFEFEIFYFSFLPDLARIWAEDQGEGDESFISSRKTISCKRISKYYREWTC